MFDAFDVLNPDTLSVVTPVLLNIYAKSETFDVSKLETLIDVILEQLLNIPLILVTFVVTNDVMLSCVRFVQLLNMSVKFVAFDVLKLETSISERLLFPINSP